MQVQNDQMSQQLKESDDTLTRMLRERDQYKDDTSELYESKKKLDKLLSILQMTSKERVLHLETELKRKNEENDKNMDEIIKLEKTNKQYQMEKDKLKFRIAKLMQRKGKFDSGFKTCKNCGKEYNEKENFNWSCRQHQSDYGGEMWWCCGKQGKDQPGCKFSMHESKDDDDKMSDEGDPDRAKHNKNIRCASCKEMGHSVESCPRDPNFRSQADADEEF